MKYKRMALAACALLLLLSATNLSAVLTDEHPRYHQHLERPAYTPCAEHDGETLCTHLPLVLIDTGGEAIPGVPIPDADSNIENNRFTTTADGSTLLRASVSVVDHAEGNNHPADAPTLQSTIDIRVRGNSSRYFDKHGYLVKTLTDDGAASRDVAMLGMDAFDEWALYGPYLDKTLIRNYMWYNLAGEIMDYAPNVRFCEVLLNGVYQGLYVMTETINSSRDARLKLTEPSKDTVQTSYALRLDRGSDNEVKNIETFSQYALRNLQDMDIVYPGTKWLTPERAAWIAQDFSDFEKSLFSYDYDTEPYSGEAALYSARQGCAYAFGHGMLCAFGNKRMVGESEQLDRLRRRTAEAVSKGEFEPYFQFVVDRGGTIIGAETVSRWQSPEDGLLPPSKYIDLMIRAGTITELDLYMLRCACVQLQTWKREGCGTLWLSCNFTRQSIADEKILARVREIVEQYDFTRDRLVVELTEDSYAHDREAALRTIEGLHAMGLRIALDDMGAGYSSLSDLCTYPIDGVKIDRSIVIESALPRARALLEGMIRLSHDMGIRVLCEGVEDKAMCDAVLAAGCDFIQGFYFSRVLPGREAESFLRSLAARDREEG